MTEITGYPSIEKFIKAYRQAEKIAFGDNPERAQKAMPEFNRLNRLWVEYRNSRSES